MSDIIYISKDHKHMIMEEDYSIRCRDYTKAKKNLKELCDCLQNDIFNICSQGSVDITINENLVIEAVDSDDFGDIIHRVLNEILFAAKTMNEFNPENFAKFQPVK